MLTVMCAYPNALGFDDGVHRLLELLLAAYDGGIHAAGVGASSGTCRDVARASTLPFLMHVPVHVPTAHQLSVTRTHRCRQRALRGTGAVHLHRRPATVLRG